MKILFVGLLYDRESEAKYLKKSKIALQGASNTFQWNLIDGLKENSGIELRIINTLPVGTYPNQYDELRIKSKEWNYKGTDCFEIGFINLPFVKMKMREKGIHKKLCEIILSSSNEELNILVYSLYLPFLDVLKKIKKKFKNVKSTVIVPDLPCEYGILPKNKLKKALMLHYGKKTLSYYNYIDSYIILTDAMKYPLKISDKPYCVIEGIANPSKKIPAVNGFNKKKVIMYAGTLLPEFGIITLLEAFELIQGESYELWICGSGGVESKIKQYAEKDKRIKYFGYVSKEKTLEMQQKASVLVNPRPNDSEYTKYSFPSKTMEYMASGKPVIMFKLDGIPDDYDEYLNYVDSHSDKIIGLKDKISEVLLNYDDAAKKAVLAQKYVLDYKNGKAQARKILNFIKGNKS